MTFYIYSMNAGGFAARICLNKYDVMHSRIKNYGTETHYSNEYDCFGANLEMHWRNLSLLPRLDKY